MTMLTCAAVVGASAMTLLLGSPVSDGAQFPSSGVVCKHETSESQADRSRREQAIALARAINKAEGILSQQTRKYHQLAELPSLPPTPNGFDLRLYSDGAGYVLSIKDTLDPCSYGVFSDQAGLLYEKTPLAAPLIAGRR